MSKIVLVTGEDDPLDDLQPCVTALLRFYEAMHTDPSLLPIAFADAVPGSRVGELLAGGILCQRGFVFAVPGSPLQHVYAEVVQRVLTQQPAGLCTWVVHAESSRASALELEALLHRRRANVHPRMQWDPSWERAALHTEALRFLNFSFTHCRDFGSRP